MRKLLALLATLAALLPLAAHAAITRTELAGHPLIGEYPYFRYARSFQFPWPPKVAIDPNRYPAIVGQTCDLYYVRHKTPDVWAADPALIDVRPRGASRHTFVAGSIESNVLSALPTGVLSDDAGANLGAAYDVVLDCNRDGLLNGDDYIDGLGSEAGFYLIHDIAHRGPYDVKTNLYRLSPALATIYRIPAPLSAEKIFFPKNIGLLGTLPVVILSHGNGYNILDYDYLGEHLASWGYIVMIHGSDPRPGPAESAAMTLRHTDAFLDGALSGVIAKNELTQHIDSGKIAWVGHGRGGEGVVIAYHQLFTGEYVPTKYRRQEIRLVDSMGPTDFQWRSASGGPGPTQPHDANYHLWAPLGSFNVSGDPANPTMQSLPIADRATGYKLVTTVQGMAESQFSSRAVTPLIFGMYPMRTSSAHYVVNGYMVALLKYFLDGQLPALDFLTRQQEQFYPMGIDPFPISVIQSEFRSGAPDRVVLDDYQSAPSVAVSSSGGAVTYDVDEISEGRLADNDGTFVWSATDPFNGCILATSLDESRGVSFEWKDRDRFYEWAIPAADADFSRHEFLSLRGAQITRHPFTTAVSGDLYFDVQLRDAAGHTSTISTRNSGGFEEPFDGGGGWYNEMSTMRLRLTDFQINGSGLDLSKIVAVRLVAGPSHGAARGRIVLDDLMLTSDVLP